MLIEDNQQAHAACRAEQFEPRTVPEIQDPSSEVPDDQVNTE